MHTWLLITHKACSSIQELSCYFQCHPSKFRGHRGRKIDDLAPIWTYLQFEFLHEYEMTHITFGNMEEVRIVLQYNLSNFDVTWANKSVWISFEIKCLIPDIKSLRFVLFHLCSLLPLFAVCHVSNNMAVSRQSYLYHGNLYSWNDITYVEMGTYFSTVTNKVNICVYKYFILVILWKQTRFTVNCNILLVVHAEGAVASSSNLNS